MILPNDIARCPGYGYQEDDGQEGFLRDDQESY
jgi:hypothetical protein